MKKIIEPFETRDYAGEPSQSLDALASSIGTLFAPPSGRRDSGTETAAAFAHRHEMRLISTQANHSNLCSLLEFDMGATILHELMHASESCYEGALTAKL